jgi:protein subunit release factor A
MKTRLLGMFSKKSSFDKNSSDLTKEIASKLELVVAELSKRRQSARTLDLIQSKEVIKLMTSIESGNVTPDSLSTIADANVLWSALAFTLREKENILSSDKTKGIMESSVNDMKELVAELPVHHKRLVSVLIPMIEILGEDNVVVAERMLKEIGNAIASQTNTGTL